MNEFTYKLHFGMVLHLGHIWVKFEYQGHWVKVKVILWKILILLPRHQFNLVDLSEVKVINMVKVISRSRSFQGQIVSV